jgi:hypothetical protein
VCVREGWRQREKDLPPRHKNNGLDNKEFWERPDGHEILFEFVVKHHLGERERGKDKKSEAVLFQVVVKKQLKPIFCTKKKSKKI